MWIMVLVVLNNLSSTDMIHIDDIHSGLSVKYDTEEACNKDLYKIVDKAPRPPDATIKRDDAYWLTLTLRDVNPLGTERGVHTLVFTCTPIFTPPH